jgi:hypothetical protein
MDGGLEIPVLELRCNWLFYFSLLVKCQAKLSSLLIKTI